MDCKHEKTICLNEYEYVRKYKCVSCSEVMMCACDEERGHRYLPHQLSSGIDLVTKERIAVTIGFQPNICRECRGLPVEPYPRSAIMGRTSKVKMYYWRELNWRKMELLDESNSDGGLDYKAAETKALEEIKHLHQTTPKYKYLQKESQADFLTQCKVEVIPLKGVYVNNHSERKALILLDDEPLTAEEFASRHFEDQGYSTISLESIPFHVLFGVFMWLLVQDSNDDKVRIVGFSNRHDTENSDSSSQDVWSHLPEDFGAIGYGERRKKEIDEHFSTMLIPGDLSWLFEYWLEPSEKLRHYLWAHRKANIDTARKLINILPSSILLKILRYLIDSYWERYLGWPDLVVFRDDEFFFAEVKSSKDKLSDDQRSWIKANHDILQIPFKLIKIHKTDGIKT